MKDKKTEIEQNLIQEHAEWKTCINTGDRILSGRMDVI